MTDEAFDSARLIFIVLTMCLKVILMPLYLQAYLNIAYTRLENQKKEAGRITNVELQQKVCIVDRNIFTHISKIIVKSPFFIRIIFYGLLL